MISSQEMLDKLIKLADEKIKREFNKNGLIITYNRDFLKSIVDEAEVFLNDNLNIHTVENVNREKKASVLELMILHEAPLKLSSPKHAEIEITINAHFAMSSATLFLFDTPYLTIDTQQDNSVNIPFHNVLKNHLIWLKKLEIDPDHTAPFISNASFWTLVKIIVDNKHCFNSI